MWAANDGGSGAAAVAEATPLSDAMLASLTLTDGDGTPIPLKLDRVAAAGLGFAITPDLYRSNPGNYDVVRFDYSGVAPLEATEVRVTATAAGPVSSLTAAGAALAGGTPSEAVTLEVNKALGFDVVVTAPGGKQRTYRISLSRPPSAVRNLAAAAGFESLALSWNEPAFGGTDTTDAQYRLRWRPVTDDDSAAWQPGPGGRFVAAAGSLVAETVGGLTAGSAYEVEVWMINDGGSGLAVRATATPLASGGALEALRVADDSGVVLALSLTALADRDGGAITLADYLADPSSQVVGTFDLTAGVPFAATGVRVTATLSDDTATLAVNGTAAVSGTPSGLVAVPARQGATVTVTVTSGGGGHPPPPPPAGGPRPGGAAG